MTKRSSTLFARIIFFIGIAVGLSLVVFWIKPRDDDQTRGDGVREATNRTVNLAVSRNTSFDPPEAATNDLASSANKFLSARSLEERRAAFEALRAQLKSLSPEKVSGFIQRVLDSRVDASTGMEFKPGRNGLLVQAPTFRTFLLDQLVQVDAETAAEYAEKILSSPHSADEWAVSLRNYALARTNAEARVFLQQKFREMIGQDSWRNEPSVGFLESFDVAVHAGGAELVPDLTGLVRDKDNKAVAHAAYLALDRLAMNEPAAVLSELLERLETMAGREMTRANFFARADVRDAQQRQILEDYLLNTRINSAELNVFAGIFPNANYMVSHNLLTRTTTPDRDTLIQLDRQALQTVHGWMADSRFDKVKPQLENIRQRLETFVWQAGERTQN